MSNITPHQRKALNYNEHISLTANAGSGKTFVLSKRFVEIAINENVSLRNIVAITFTEKAASELYRKVSDEISQRLNKSKSINEKRKLERIRQQLVSANISTIHSFCISILKEYPIESNIDSNFTPIEQNAADELVQLCIEEVIKKNLEDEFKKDEIRYIIRTFSSKSILTTILSVMINKRKNILKCSSMIYSKSIQEISEYFFSEFKVHLARILEKNKNIVSENISVINDAVLIKSPNNSIAIEIKTLIKKFIFSTKIEDTLNIINIIKDKLLTKSLEIRKQGYLKNDREIYSDSIKFVEKYFSEINDFVIEEDHLEVEYELAKLGKVLVGLFDEVLKLYTEKKLKNGYLDFEDILLNTQKVLTNTKVSKQLTEKYKYIMVDEYQDTNEIQYEIFMPILDNLKKGNLFVVGDEKQSIYMFRDAELEVFNKTKIDITQISGESNLLTLPDSFRMAPGVCLFVNYIFKKLFNDPDIIFNEVNYSDLVCGKDESVEGGIEIILANSDCEDNTEAELIAKRIIKLRNDLSDNLEFGEIAVLCRKRKSFEELERIFDKYKIPYNILGGKGFYQRQIIFDVFNYLSFLFNPNNDTALISLLRSPFFSVSDAEIFGLSLEKKENYWGNLRLLASQNTKFDKIYNRLKENLSLSNQFDITSLLRKIIDESGFIAVLSSKPDCDQQIANLEKLINISLSFNTSGHKTLYDFITFLDNAINSSEDESQASVFNSENSVKIMTLHQAKGMEYKVVFLYSCHDYTQRDIVKTKSLSINKELGILTTVPIKNNYFEDYKAAPIVALHNYIMRRKNIAEIKRLFYVGVTRAKNYLFISGLNRNSKYHPESFMNLLFEGLNIDILGDKFIIEDELMFLKSNSSNYFNEKKLLKIEIPVIHSINGSLPIEENNIFETEREKKVKVKQINDIEQDEIFNATRFAIYNQCPVKYLLTYELGYLKLFRNLRVGHSSDFSSQLNEHSYLDLNKKEDKELFNFADIKGKIIHQILEREVKLEKVEEEVEKIILNEVEYISLNNNAIEYLKKDIINHLRNFCSSDIYKVLLSYKNYQNGFEIYSKENDYYLHGIINKIVFLEDRIIIIDYKTDNVLLNEIEKRSAEYEKQTFFYGLLVKKLYPNYNNIESWLVFTKCFTAVRRRIEIEKIEYIRNEIKITINKIRSENFTKNLNHCKNCHYYENNNCMVE